MAVLAIGRRQISFTTAAARHCHILSWREASVGIATGVQDKCSFKGVALAAISGGVAGGLGGGDLIGGAGKLVNGVARGALANAATQGIAIATGLQGRFDWTGVAVGGLGAGRTFGGQLVARRGRSPARRRAR